MEVLSLCQAALLAHRQGLHSALETKWKVNLFLSKWLAFCLSRGYRFSPERDVPLASEAGILAPIAGP